MNDVTKRKRMIDMTHPRITQFGMPLIDDVWGNKYQWTGETPDNDMEDTVARVVRGIYAKDENKEAASAMLRIMEAGLWMPGGRILAGAGTSKVVTLMNCYVNRTVEDSMQGIHSAVGDTMFTLQQGGGIGTDFSTLRPSGASLKRTGPGSAASGPIPFMMQWDATSMTIKSAGDRRGAMMGTLSDWHPDLPAFIDAKHKAGILTQFNVSILISDAFMEAVDADASWALYFPHEPAGERDPETTSHDFTDENGIHQYVYSLWNARELWDKIMRSTYDHAEPGVIFIDRVNDLNNLSYCETIRCTNPCGEQPLPPNGTCNLGAINLARMVKRPFTPDASVDWDLLDAVATHGVRFLDNVIDVTKYPLEAQGDEERNKRRLGMGISGLADCLAQLSIVYGSDESVRMVEKIMASIANSAYMASAMLANERGTFPLYDSEHILQAPFVRKLNEEVQATISDLGLRNGVILTIAPTGTTSLVYGNISSGLEPNFAHSYNRKVFSSNNEHQAEQYEEVTTYLLRLYRNWLEASDPGYVAQYGHSNTDLPEYMVTAQDLGVSAHLRIQAACQKWVDASISKTINVPEHCSFEDFKAIYAQAYHMGCKGCTTYRPNPDSGRGSVLEVAPTEAAEEVVAESTLRERPELLQGITYKIKWPSWQSAVYVTINHDEEGVPFEIFIMSKDSRYQEWMTAVTVMISANMRRDKNILWIPEELKTIQSVGDSSFSGGKFYGSLLARIGDVIEQHYKRIGLIETDESEIHSGDPVDLTATNQHMPRGETCPNCSAPTLFMSEGCKKCTSCGYSQCG